MFYKLVWFYFRIGSIKASYKLKLAGDKLKSAIKHIKSVEENLVNTIIADRKVNQTYTKDAMEKAINDTSGKQHTI